MFHYGNQPINSIRDDILNINALQKNILALPEPILSKQVIDTDFSYSDCFEISFLRFFQILLHKDGLIDLKKLKNLIGETYLDNELYNFFLKNSIINNNFISSNLRINWCRFLNDRDFLIYKFDSKIKVQPIQQNIIYFFNHFFPLLRITKIKEIFKLFSSDNIYNCKIFNNGWSTKEKIYDESLIKIFINGNNIYDWKFYQYYENLSNLKGKIITGHCELKYSTYIQKYF